MTRLLPVLLLLTTFLPAQAQQAVIDTLNWRATRRLQLSDFHSPTQPGLGGSEFYYQIAYEAKPIGFGSAPAIEAFCLMFRNLSWVSETARNERTLAYNQVLFDLVEIHTRQMKAKLIALGADRNFKKQAKQIEYLTNSELGAEVNRFRAETGGGDDLTALQRWQRDVAQRLFDTPDQITIYRSSRLGYGFFVGGGGAIPTGPLAQSLNLPVGVLFGFDLALDRTMLLLHPSLYNTTLRRGFSHHNLTWEAGMNISSTLLEVGLGRIVHDSPRSRLIPYFGYRLLELTPRNRNDERYKGYSVLNHAPAVGLLFDLKFGDNSRRDDRPDNSFWIVRTKLSYSPLLNGKPFSGGLLNLQIGVGGFGRMRKVNYRSDRTVIPLPSTAL